ncbi:MAG: hypothetical protein ACJ76X_04035 [Solirubrobacteraceae bacterium]
MDSEGPETEEGTTTSNVVRLPRDWLGPREELVPFGPAAERKSAPPFDPLSVDDERAPAPPFGSSSVDDQPAPAPPSASDFWGEHSADMHHVLQGPVPAPVPTPAPIPSPEETPPPLEDAASLDRAGAPWLRRSRRRIGIRTRIRNATSGRLATRSRELWWRRWAERRTAQPAPGSTPDQRPASATRDDKLDGRRISAAAVAGVALATVVGLAATAFVAGSIGGPPRGGRIASRVAGADHTLGLGRILRSELVAGPVQASALSVARAAARHASTGRRVHRSARTRHHRAAPAATQVATATPTSASSLRTSSTTASSTAAATSSSATSADSGSGSGGGSFGGGSSDAGGSSGSGGGSGSSAGPVGPGAPFGPGHLG